MSHKNQDTKTDRLTYKSSLYSSFEIKSTNLEISVCWGNQPENFLPLENMVPDAGTAKVDVKICITTSYRHQAIFLYLI